MMNLFTVNEREMIKGKMEKHIREERDARNIDKSYDNLIEHWYDAKSIKLLKMFGGETILKKEIKIEKDTAQLSDEMRGKLRHYFFTLREAVFREGTETQEYNNELLNVIDKLNWSSDALALNSVEKSFEVRPRSLNGKAIKINKGQKVTKAFAKLFSAFGIEDSVFEEFRIKHSQILNDRVIRGTLCLSIHPLDYLTMSDNANGWSSCMSFDEEGCYRAGVLECLNCSNTIVAYLESNNQKYEIKGVDGETYFWNSKKYRQLVLADRNFILTNKSYPFRNDNLSQLVLDWVAELAGEDFEGENIFENDYESRSIKGISGFCVDTDMMYNDHSHGSFSYIRLNKNLSEEDLTSNGFAYTSINGVAHCLNCDEAIEKESCVLCNECAGLSCCEYCGESLTRDEVCYIEDNVACEYCLDEHGYYCQGCSETFSEEHGRYVDHDDETYIVPDWQDGFYCDCCLDDLELREEEEEDDE